MPQSQKCNYLNDNRFNLSDVEVNPLKVDSSDGLMTLNFYRGFSYDY